jgi:hypothetical protein
MKPPPHNLQGLHIFLWLKTLVECRKAVSRFTQTAKDCQNFVGTLVRFTDYTAASFKEEAKESLREAVRAATTSDRNLAIRAEAWVEDKLATLKEYFRGRVHAETGLMAVACMGASFSAPPQLQEVSGIFVVRPLDLAASRMVPYNSAYDCL